MTLAQLIAQHPEIAALKQNYPAIAAALNAATTGPNPDAGKKTQVNAPVTLPAVLAVVPSAERVAIRQLLPNFNEDVKGAIDSGDEGYMAGLIEDALTANAITTNTVTALTALLAKQTEITAPATIAGPSLAEAAGLGTVTAANVQAADTASGAWPA